MQSIQSLFSRVKRQAANTVKTGDLKKFRDNNGAYLKFIDELKSVLTEPGEQYGNIKVTKRKDGVTKVILKDGGRQVEFIYRNRDLYIIGFVVGSKLYIDKEVYDGLQKRLPKSWSDVIGASSVEALSVPFSYNNILPSGENSELAVGKLGESLNKLTEISDRNKRSQIMSQHLGPFVVAFSEAVRFPVVARAVQDSIRSNTGTVKLSTNLIKPLSLGHPSQRGKGYVFSMYSLLLNWAKLSDRVPPLYKNQDAPPLVDGKYTLNLEKNQLNTLLGVANSYRFQKFTIVPSRGRRDLSQLPYESVKQQQPMLENKIELIDYDDGRIVTSERSAISSITHSPDVIGALQLLTLGMLYLSGKKLNISIGVHSSYDPQEAQAIAVDLVDRIMCFLYLSGDPLRLNYDDVMELQRKTSIGLMQGDPIDQLVTKFIGQKYAEKNNNMERIVDLDKANKVISSLLAESNGFPPVKEYRNIADSCNF